MSVSLYTMKLSVYKRHYNEVNFIAHRDRAIEHYSIHIMIR